MKIFDSNRKMNREGSLQLSINAIVVLVMAMVVLGLGLGFIRNLINKGQDKFVNVMAGIDIKNKATSSDPITVLPELNLKRGGSSKVEIGYYNTNSQCAKASPAFTKTASGVLSSIANAGNVACIDSNGALFDTGSFQIIAQSIDVQAGSETGFLAQLIDGCGATTPPNECGSNPKIPSGDYVCTFAVAEVPCDATGTSPNQIGPSKQVIVHVSN